MQKEKGSSKRSKIRKKDEVHEEIVAFRFVGILVLIFIAISFVIIWGRLDMIAHRVDGYASYKADTATNDSAIQELKAKLDNHRHGFFNRGIYK